MRSNETEVVDLPTTDMPEIGNLQQLLDVNLSPDEWAARATASAMLGGELAEMRADLDQYRRNANEEMKMLREERERADRAVRSRSEPRPVGVRVFADLGRNEAVHVRVDTGEVVERIGLTTKQAAAGRQRVLDFPS